MTEKLTYGVKQTKTGYMGFVSCWYGSLLVWTDDTDIIRTHKQDAIDDARLLMHDTWEVSVIETKTPATHHRKGGQV